MTTDSTRTRETPPRPGRRHGLGWWQAILAAAGAATVVDLALLGAGHAAGATFVLDDRGAPHVVALADVVSASVWPIAVGMGLAVLLARGLWAWRTPVLRVALVVGGALALASAAGPMLGVTDPGTRLALALMHVVVGAAVVLGLEAVRRRWAEPA